MNYVYRGLSDHLSSHRAEFLVTLGSYVVAMSPLLLVARALRNQMKRMLFLSVEFDIKDPSYAWIIEWLTRQPGTRKCRDLTVSTRAVGGGSPNLTDETVVVFTPGPGLHFIRVHGYFAMLERVMRTNDASSKREDTFSLTILFGSQKLIEEIVREAKEAEKERERERTVVYTGDQYGVWRKSRSRPKRDLASVILDGNAAEKLVADAKRFLLAEKWYANRGIPYRRGYLLYGPPGSGKTSFITALAGVLALNVYVVSLGNKLINDEVLAELLANCPTRCIVLLEDIDATVSHDGHTSENGAITFSGLLNAIDGVAAQEGRILILTTNHAQRLPESLIRPGRVDLRVYFGYATEKQVERLFRCFYYTEPPTSPAPGSPLLMSADDSAPASPQPAASASHENNKNNNKNHSTALAQSEEDGDDAFTSTDLSIDIHALAKQFADEFRAAKTEDGSLHISMAALQGYLMNYKTDPEAAVRDFRTYIRDGARTELVTEH